MTLKECYELNGSDYEAALSRLGSEEVMDVIVTMFADDDTFSVLKSCIAEGNIEEAQRAAHKLKGVTSNIGFGLLASNRYGSNASCNFDYFFIRLYIL